MPSICCEVGSLSRTPLILALAKTSGWSTGDHITDFEACTNAVSAYRRYLMETYHIVGHENSDIPMMQPEFPSQ